MTGPQVWTQARFLVSFRGTRRISTHSSTALCCYRLTDIHCLVQEELLETYIVHPFSQVGKPDHQSGRYLEIHSRQLLHVLFCFSGCIYFGVMPSKINTTNSPMKLIITLTVRPLSKILPLLHTLSSLHGKISCLVLEQMIFGSSLGQLVPFLYYGRCEAFYKQDFLFSIPLILILICLCYVFLPLFSFHLLSGFLIYATFVNSICVSMCICM